MRQGSRHRDYAFRVASVGYIVVGTFDAAERAARTAIDLDRTGKFPYFLLCLALYFENKFTDETPRYAERTSDEYPQAPFYAARTFMEKNDFERARDEIQTYLSGDKRDPSLVDLATSWLDIIAARRQKAAAVFP